MIRKNSLNLMGPLSSAQTSPQSIFVKNLNMELLGDVKTALPGASVIVDKIFYYFFLLFIIGNLYFGGYGNYVPSLKGTVILEKTVLVIYKIL